MHFVVPRSYESIVPHWLPRRREAVIISGIAEIVGAAALLPPSSRRLARWWLLGLLLAVFPANVQMALTPELVPGLNLTAFPAGRCGRGCRCNRWRCSGSGAQPRIERSSAGGGPVGWGKSTPGRRSG